MAAEHERGNGAALWKLLRAPPGARDTGPISRPVSCGSSGIFGFDSPSLRHPALHDPWQTKLGEGMLPCGREGFKMLM